MSDHKEVLAALNNPHLRFSSLADFPHLKEVTAHEFWSWMTIYLTKDPLWGGNVGREGTALIFPVMHSQFIDGGFMVLKQYSYPEPVPERYFTWMACDHKFERRNIGNCLNRYTCVHCKKYYDVDSSG